LIAKDIQGLDNIFAAINAKLKRKVEKRDQEHLACIERVKEVLGKGEFVKD